MIDVNDVRGLRMARSELSKRGIDTIRADIRVMHGVCHIRGAIGPMPGAKIDNVKTEVEHIALLLRQRKEIRDVMLECTYQGEAKA